MKHHAARGLPYFPMYVDDILADNLCEAMTNEEFGIYMRFLLRAWRETPAGTIPADDRILARWAGVTPKRWETLKETVLSPFRPGEDKRLHQKRMEAEYQRLLHKSATARSAVQAREDKRNGVPSPASDPPPSDDRTMIGRSSNDDRAIIQSESRVQSPDRESLSSPQRHLKILARATGQDPTTKDRTTLRDLAQEHGDEVLEAALLKGSLKSKARPRSATYFVGVCTEIAAEGNSPEDLTRWIGRLHRQFDEKFPIDQPLPGAVPEGEEELVLTPSHNPRPASAE